jgi:hypothetical protein
MAHRLGWRGLAVVLAAGLLLALTVFALVAGIAEVHLKPLKGLAMLVIAWTIGVFASTFFSRLLGVWCHQSRPAAVAEPEAEAAAEEETE